MLHMLKGVDVCSAATGAGRILITMMNIRLTSKTLTLLHRTNDNARDTPAREADNLKPDTTKTLF